MTHAAMPLESDIVAPSAWTAADIDVADWRLPVSDACCRELRDAIDWWRANPLPLELLDTAGLALPLTRALAQRARGMLDAGTGIAVIDRLPLDGHDEDEAKALYWLLSSAMSRVVAGAWDGRMLHDVVDLARQQGLRVRGDVTREELRWHTDNGFSCTPEHVGLLCIRPAEHGGRNSVLSLHSAHNLMRQRHPRLLPRLYRDFWWNRMGEHPPADSQVNRYPIFERDGTRVKGRINRRVVEAGHALAGEAFDDEGRAAVDALYEVFEDSSLTMSFTLEAGQAVYLNNRTVAHHRTPFVDVTDPTRRRHLVRIYLREHGPRSYLGAEGLARLPQVHAAQSTRT
jgi:hypothetical protein